jgi:hypothetical protein
MVNSYERAKPSNLIFLSWVVKNKRVCIFILILLEYFTSFFMLN